MLRTCNDVILRGQFWCKDVLQLICLQDIQVKSVLDGSGLKPSCAVLLCFHLFWKEFSRGSLRVHLFGKQRCRQFFCYCGVIFHPKNSHNVFTLLCSLVLLLFTVLDCDQVATWAYFVQCSWSPKCTIDAICKGRMLLIFSYVSLCLSS